MGPVLVIAPHPDDAELAMGGTIAVLRAEGIAVTVLDLTNGEPTPMGTVETRLAEAAAAAAVLDVRRVTLDLPNRRLEHTVVAREQVAEVIREVRPELLCVPYWVDAHPDHVAAASLAEAARFAAKLTKTAMRGEPHYPRRVVHFLSSHYRLHVRPSFIVDVSAHMERKMAACRAYRSQFNEARGSDRVLEEVRDLGRYYGHLVGAAYGEPFVSREEIGLRSLRDLL